MHLPTTPRDAQSIHLAARVGVHSNQPSITDITISCKDSPTHFRTQGSKNRSIMLMHKFKCICKCMSVDTLISVIVITGVL